MHTDAQVTGDDDPQSGNDATLLLLADGRFPSGGHAHSAGVEAAAEHEGVHDTATLEEFVRGRLATAGVVAASFAAAACAATNCGADVAVLDAEFAARTPSPALRKASHRLGRQVLRSGRSIWPDPRLDALPAALEHGPHQPVAFGAVAAVAGLTPRATALGSAHDAVLTPASAAVRLLGLDPYAVHRMVARLGEQITATAEAATGYAEAAPAELPAHAGPLLDVSAERHATWEVRLFAS